MTPLEVRIGTHLIVTEQRGWWVKGRLRRDESVAVELAFDNPRLDDIPMADDIPLVYLGLFTTGRCLFEFQNGFLCQSPVDDRVHATVFDIVLAVTGYRHTPVPVPRPRSILIPSVDEPAAKQKRLKPRYVKRRLTYRS